GAALLGIKAIRLVHPDPRQLLPPLCERVALPGELLLRLEQVEPRCEALFTCPGRVLHHRRRHCSSLLRASHCDLVVAVDEVELAPGIDRVRVTSVTGFRLPEWIR